MAGGELTGKLIADFSSFFSAVDQSITKVKDLDASASTVGARLEAMANSFSGARVVQQADLAVKAVTDLGGATALTEKEQTRLNNLLDEAIAKYDALGVEAPAALREMQAATAGAGEAMTTLHETVNGVGDQIKATALGFVSAQGVIMGVQKAIGFLTDSFQAYAANEANVKKLTVALQQQGEATPEVISQYRDLAEEYSHTTIYSDNLVTSAERLFTEIGQVGPGEMDAALNAATNLASGLGIDLTQAATMLSKAAEGNVTSLRKVGVALDSAAVKAGGLPVVLDAINKRFGGQAAADMDTTAGKIELLKNNWEKLEEKIGEIEAKDPVLKAMLTGATRELDDQTKAVQTDASWWEKLIGFYNNWISISGTLTRQVQAGTTAINDLDEAKAHLLAGTPKPPTLGFDFAGLAADAQADLDRVAAELKKAEEAAKQYAEQVQSLADQLDGADLARKSKELADALALVERQGPPSAATLKRFGDAAAKLLEAGAPLNAQLTDLAVRFNGLIAPATDAAAKMDELGLKVGKLTMPAMIGMGEAMDDLTKKALIGNMEISRLMGEIGTKVQPGFKEAAKAIDETQKAAQRLEEQGIKELEKGFNELGTAIGTFDASLGKVFTDMGRSIGAIDNANKSMKTFEDTFNNPDVSGAAKLEAGAGAILSIGAASIQAGQAVDGLLQKMGMGHTAASAISGAAGGALGGMEMGTMIGMMGGPIGAGVGAAIGAVAGGAIGIVKGLFGTAGRQAVTAFASSMGGFDALHTKLDALGASGEQMWIKLTQGVGKNDAAGAQAAIQQVTAALNALQADEAKYNLADPLKASNDAAQALYKSFEDLVSAGHDTSAVTKAMAGDVNTWLGAALDAGAKIPPGMQPILDQLIQMGELTDDNARKLLGLDTKLTGGTFDDVTAAAQRYGIQLDALGPKVNQLNIEKQAAQLSSDWKMLTSDGEDVNAVMDGMKSKVQDVVTAALKFGDSVPASMQPMVDQMIAAGDLTDQFGKKLTDDSQINWETPLTDQVDTLVKSIQLLVDTLTGGGSKSLSGALSTIGGTVVNPKIQPVYDDSQIPPTYQSGGTPTLSSSNASALTTPAPSGGGDITVNLNADGRKLAQVVVPNIPAVVTSKGLNR